jgi:hypothetical protein
VSLQIILKNSSVSGKEPLASQLANGELALNYNSAGPFITCKDSTGTVRRIAGVWINVTAPATPTPGEFWLDLSTNPPKLKIYKDTTDNWIDTSGGVNLATEATAGEVELATNAETQTGTDVNRAVTPAGLQSKISDSTVTADSNTIASSQAVKSVADVANAALPAAGGEISGDLTVTGDLTVSGTTTTINTEILSVKDHNIELGKVNTPTDATADGGGLTLAGATDKTLNWVNTTDSWTSSENVDLANGKTYKINTTDVLSSTTLGSNVVNSSLTGLGTVATGTWNATPIATDYIADSAITNAKINAQAVSSSKILGGTAYQLLHTKSDASGVEWTDNIDIPGTLDVTSTATFDSDLTVDTNVFHVDATDDRVGVGTTAPETKLHVAGAITAGANTSSTSGDDVLLQSNYASGNIGVISSMYYTGGLCIGYGVKGGGGILNQFTSTTDLSTKRQAYIQESSGHKWYGQSVAASTTIGNNQALLEYMQLDEDGYLRFSSNAKGIQFKGDTTASNTLDEYEEGYWTPVLSDGTNDATHTIQYARYTVVGNLVHITCYVRTSNISALTGSSTYITGLPFEVATWGYAGTSAAYGSGLNLTASKTVSVYAQPGGSKLILYSWKSTAGVDALTPSEWSSDGGLIFSTTYSMA